VGLLSESEYGSSCSSATERSNRTGGNQGKDRQQDGPFKSLCEREHQVGLFADILFQGQSLQKTCQKQTLQEITSDPNEIFKYQHVGLLIDK